MKCWRRSPHSPRWQTRPCTIRRNEYNAVYNGNLTLEGGNILGIDAHYLNVYGYQITRGRGFTDKDFTDNRKVALLDKTAASNSVPGG